MKKFLLVFVAAILGGAFSLGAFKLISDKKSGWETSQSERIPAYKTNMPVGGAMALPDFTAAANSAIHQVVHIKTEYSPRQGRNSQFYDLWDFFGQGMPRQQQQPSMGAGSGVIISPDGYIVTNNHVVEESLKVQVTLNDKRTYDAEVVGTDPSTDLALLKIQENDLPYAQFGNSDALQIGEWVLAVGNPFNLTSTVTAGIVSAKARNINILGTPDGTSIESFIQTDAAVNRGNSGGALINTRGELVGINAAIASMTGTYAGYSFAIPVNLVRKVVDDLREFGNVQRGFIGVSITNIDSELARQEGIKELSGVYVSDVTEGGSAKEAGLRKGDVITSIEGVNVNSSSQLLEIIGQHRPGDRINVTVRRDNRERDYKLLLKNREGTTGVVKRDVAGENLTNSLGATFSSLTDQERSRLRIDSGIKVTGLSANSKLAEAGIRQGFIITSVDEKPVNSVEDITKILSNKKGGVLVEGVYPNGMRAYYGFGM